MSSLNAAIGVAVALGLFFVVTQFGKQFGEGAKGISEGISSLLSPSIVPTVGFQTEVPTWLSDILGGTRTEDRPLSTVEPSPIRTEEGTINPFWLLQYGNILPRLEDRTSKTPTETTTTRTEDRMSTYPSEIKKIMGRVTP